MNIDRNGLPNANKYSWQAYGVLLVLVVVTASLYLSKLSYGWVYVLLVVLLAVLFSVLLVKTSWHVVPPNEEHVFSFLGQFSAVYKSGRYLIFDWLNSFDCEAELSEKQDEVFPNRSVFIDFKDGLSAYVEVDIVYCITDSIAFAYGASDSKVAMLSRVRSNVIKKLEKYRYESGAKEKGVKDSKDLLKLSKFFSPKELKEIHDDFGITLKKLVIGDFRLSPADQLKRDLLYAASKDLEIAKITAKKTAVEADAKKKAVIKIAEGTKIALTNEGAGLANQIDFLTDMLSPDQAVKHLGNIVKFKDQNERTTVIIEGDGESGRGAKFGAGFATTSKKP